MSDASPDEPQYLLGALAESDVRALAAGTVTPAVQQRAADTLDWWTRALAELPPEDQALLRSHKAARAAECRALRADNRRLRATRAVNR